MTSKTNTGLVEWCLSKLGCGYIYGTYFAAIITEQLIQAKANQYPSRYTSGYIERSRKWIGHEAGDCVGLIKGYYWYDPSRLKVVYKFDGRPDTSANGMRNAATVKGSIDTMPETPGICLHKDGHIGVYIGGGYAIESRGVDYGVVKTAVAGRGWTSWLKCPFIDYTEEGDTMLQSGNKGLAVTYWQKSLLKWNPSCLPKFGADSDFGAETTAATKSFQASVSLDQTGIVNTNTFAYMCNVLNNLDQSAKVAELTAELAKVNNLYIVEQNISAQWAERSSNYNADLKALAGSIDTILAMKAKYII